MMSSESIYQRNVILIFCLCSCPIAVWADFSPVADFMTTVRDKLATIAPSEEDTQMFKPHAEQVFTSEQKRSFCMNVRGWMLPTSSVYQRLELLFFSQEKWQEVDTQLVHAMVSRSFGYALFKLSKSSKSPHHADLVGIMRKYLSDRPLCPIACSHADYKVIEEGVGAESKSALQRVCSRNCKQVPVPSKHELKWCDCLLDGKDCSEQDLQLIATADAVAQHVFAQTDSDYESLYRYKKS